MKTFIFNKIIRDKLYLSLPQKCLSIDQTTLDKESFKSALIEKLQEEMEEIADAKSSSEFKEELADVLEVLHGLARNEGIAFNEIETIRKAKHEKKGGFKTPIRINTITLDDHHPHAKYYESKKEKYPEINKQHDLHQQ